MASGDLLIFLKWFGLSICFVLIIIIKENTHIIRWEIGNLYSDVIQKNFIICNMQYEATLILCSDIPCGFFFRNTFSISFRCIFDFSSIRFQKVSFDKCIHGAELLIIKGEKD